AVIDLNAFTEPLTSGAGEKPTPATVFRGETRGNLIGPYLSQFLWLDIPYGIKTIAQRYTVPSRGQNFLTDYAEWLACQRGAMPRSTAAFDATPRFICSARELAEYVHRDFSFQAYMNAALIMLALGKDALSPTNPYRVSRTQFGDITLGSKNCCHWSHRRRCSGRRAPTFTNGRCTGACGRRALPDRSRHTRPAGDNTTSTPTSLRATPSRESAHSMGHACCRWPSPRDVPRTRPTPRPTPATQAPAPRSSKPSSTPITSCRIQSRPRRTAWRWSP